MGPNETENRTGQLAAVSDWDAQWAQVPPEWREPAYRVGDAPASEVLVQNARYLPSGGAHPVLDFAPQGPPRFAQELAWWVWTCWREGHRKIDPAMLNCLKHAIPAAAREHQARTGFTARSIAEIGAPEIVRAATVQFERRTGRLPSPHTRKNIASPAEHLCLMLAVRCGEKPWWAHDTWDLRADPRIPRREHEPGFDATLSLGGIEPAWLREGLRFWARCALSYEMMVWSTALNRVQRVGAHFGGWCQRVGHTRDPLIAEEPDELRALFLGFLDHLRSPDASQRGQALSRGSVASVQSFVQAFYTFMFDHASEAAAATGEPRWREATVGHTRLWAPAYRPRGRREERELTWYATADLQRMLAYLDVLAADKDEHAVIEHPDGTISRVAGLGDTEAARAWLLQALTGRRASEILMLDWDPLETIPGAPPTAEADVAAGAFVAKLRYQQTKVEGVTPTIMVEQAVVNVVREQQHWLAERHPELERRYLFVSPARRRGGRARSYASYSTVLKRLDAIHGLQDSLGRPLRFAQTHRLRHTRATELLNDGVPFHVVQRYLGHKSPEMTARYAATLAATAEAEFLKHKKIGANGADIGISPRDIYEMARLGKHTDRVLPNGVCLLPPLKTCDKGNACLGCGHFATDRTHIEDLRAQREGTARLLESRRAQHLERSGRELGDENVWVAERLREIRSLDAIIAKLETDVPDGSSVAGAGTKDRLPLLQVQTRGAHRAALDNASRRLDESPR